MDTTITRLVVQVAQLIAKWVATRMVELRAALGQLFVVKLLEQPSVQLPRHQQELGQRPELWL